MNIIYFSSISALILVSLVVALILLVLSRVRRGGFVEGPPAQRAFLPSVAPKPDWTSRITESLLLGVAGGLLLLMLATARHSSGLLFTLDQLRPEFAMLIVTVFVCAVLGALTAVAVTLLWRTWAGVVLMAGVLCLYGTYPTGAGTWLEREFFPGATKTQLKLQIYLSGGIEGADVWVNDVYLGKAPVRMDMDEFLAKVPYWSEPPKDIDDPATQIKTSSYSLWGKHTDTRSRWIRFKMGRYQEQWGMDPHPRWKDDKREFFARVKLDGHWAYAIKGHSGGSGGSGSPYVYRHQISLSVTFPHRDKCLEQLLDKARLMDYQVDKLWLSAADRLGDASEKAVCKAATTEPGLSQVLDAWATHRYQLGDVTDAPAAWEAFQRICKDADVRKEYSTAYVAGRAMELVVPMLDQAQLVDYAIECMKECRGLTGGYSSGYEDGRFRFSVSMRYRPDQQQIWPRMGAVAHAVWILDELLDGHNESKPNIVEQRIVPALICWRPFGSYFETACKLGGPEINRFLERQPWRRDVSELPYRDKEYLFGLYVNKWRYMRANLRGAFGRRFRRESESALCEMADKIYAAQIDQTPEFLFLETTSDRRKGLAEKYWPKYRAFAATKKWHSLSLQWEYLAKMEPHSTIQMYVDTWRACKEDSSWRSEALLKLKALGAAKRDAVLKAISQEVEQRPALTSKGTFRSATGWQGYMSREIEEFFSDAERAKRLLAQLQSGKDRRLPVVRIPLWLARSRPDHPLVGMLADAGEPELRLMVMGALKSHPTPANRAILAKLLKDPNASVRAAAETASAALKALAAEPYPADKQTSPVWD